ENLSPYDLISSNYIKLIEDFKNLEIVTEDHIIIIIELLKNLQISLSRNNTTYIQNDFEKYLSKFPDLFCYSEKYFKNQKTVSKELYCAEVMKTVGFLISQNDKCKSTISPVFLKFEKFILQSFSESPSIELFNILFNIMVDGYFDIDSFFTIETTI